MTCICAVADDAIMSSITAYIACQFVLIMVEQYPLMWPMVYQYRMWYVNQLRNASINKFLFISKWAYSNIKSHHPACTQIKLLWIGKFKCRNTYILNTHSGDVRCKRNFGHAEVASSLDKTALHIYCMCTIRIYHGTLSQPIVAPCTLVYVPMNGLY